MIETDETPGGIPAPEPEEKRGLPPGKAFLILLAVLVAGAAVVLVLTSGGNGAPGEPRVGGAFQLSNEQALERFHELWALDERARTERDPSLISLIYTSDSESGRGAADALRDYLRDDLYDHSEIELISSEVVANTSDEIQIEVTSHLTPCIVDEHGEDALLRKPVKIEMRMTWILQPEGTNWRVQDVRSTEEQVIDRRPANACP